MSEPVAKTYLTLRARAALAGVMLYEVEDDRGRPVYIVSRLALTRQLDNLDAVAQWLDELTGVTQ